MTNDEPKEPVRALGAGPTDGDTVAAEAAPPTWADLRRAGQKMNADMGKIVSPNGIDEAGYMTVGGVRQWVTVRGQDKSLPALLYLHGGPGGALSDMSYLFQRPWEEYFTVVQWDQRGFGRSGVDADKLEGTLTLEQMAADAIDLVEQLKVRLNQPKVVVVGQSWGSLLGLELAHRRPDLLYALVTVGQVAGWDANFEETRRLLIDLAQQTKDEELLKKMTEAGPPPVDQEAFATWIGVVQGEMMARGYSWHNSNGEWGDRFQTAAILSPTVTDEELAAASTPDPARAAYTAALTATLRGWLAEKNIGTRLEVPYIVMQGDWDWQTPTTLARAYYEKVSAPWKKYIPFHHSAHVVLAEEPGKAIVSLVNDVLPAVEGKMPLGAEVRKH